MDSDLMIYADGKSQLQTAGSLIVFGAEKLKKANIVAGLPILEQCYERLKNNLPYNQVAVAQTFMFDYLIDCVRILIFFEGYMKAELIVRNFCVHTLNKEPPFAHLTTLANQQKRRPISLDEIEAVEPFVVNQSQSSITHPAVKATTLGLNLLLGAGYRPYYQLDNVLVDDIRYFNAIRNRLHFDAGGEFELSERFLDRLKRVMAFVDATLARWIRKKEAQ